MKSKILLLTSFIVLVFIISCKKEASICVCGVEDAIVNVEWLRDLKKSVKNNDEKVSAEMSLYKWNGNDYIYLQHKIISGHDFPNTIYLAGQI